MARILKLAVFGWLLQLALSASARDLDKLYAKATFTLGGQKFEAYIADDDSKREQGLMFIEKMPENTGMLFVFEREQPLGFWMKNTLIPLQIAFLDHEGKVVDIQEMSVAGSMLAKEVPTYHSRKPAVFALEMNTGWFTRHKIKPGERLSLSGKADSALLNKILSPRTKQTRQ